MTSAKKQHGVGILGGGPVGLAAAAHLLALGLEPIVFEAGSTVASNVKSYAHVPLFSPWRYNMDSAARKLLLEAGWQEPELDKLPTAGELYDEYLLPLSQTKALADKIRLNERVVAVSRSTMDKVRTAGRSDSPFVIRTQNGETQSETLVGAVIDTTGTWNTANPLGANGLPAIGEIEFGAKIFYGIPDVTGVDRKRYEGKTTLVVGAGHSAAHALLRLVDLSLESASTRTHWSVRSKNLQRVFGGGEADQLPARGALGTRLQETIQKGKLSLHTEFRIRELQEVAGQIRVLADTPSGPATLDGIDEIICVTGSRPNLEITRELRTNLDPWLESSEALAPLIDPNEHSCGTVPPHGHRELAHPEANFYVAGAKSYGRAPTFLMVTGYEQVRSIAAALAGDLAAADSVQLNLPQTGVCSANFQDEATDAPSTARKGRNRPPPAARLQSSSSRLRAARSNRATDWQRQMGAFYPTSMAPSSGPVDLVGTL